MTVPRALALTGLLLAARSASASPIDVAAYGTNGAIQQYTLTNRTGTVVKIINYGAIITNLLVPDKDGKIGDIVLGCDNVEAYEQCSAYFGAVPGRYAGRIANGAFTLNNHQYYVTLNSGLNSIHGGIRGYGRRIWSADPAITSEGPALRLTLDDADGNEGYPGNVHVTVIYTLTHTNALKIQYYATADKDTPLNLTSHSYFNLHDAGKSDVLNCIARIDASHYLPVNDTKIPTGEIAAVEGTPFDFTHFKPFNKDIQELSPETTPATTTPWSSTTRPANSPGPPKSTTLPPAASSNAGPPNHSLQFTTCPYLNNQPGKGDIIYTHSTAFCLEAQHFPDSPNHPNFPSTILHPGETYRQITEYRFSVPKTPPTTP